MSQISWKPCRHIDYVDDIDDYLPMCRLCHRALDREGLLGRRNEGGRHLSARPECVHGHEFNEENTRWVGNTRHCRECARRRVREYRQRKKAVR